MVITEIRIKLMDANQERLLGFCSLTFDDMFVVRDLKIIEGTKGFFVAMPSRKLTDRCPECGCKNHLRARFCNHCGLALDDDRALRMTSSRPGAGKVKLHADVAHPIHARCRDLIQKAVLQAYRDERERAKLPGYVCRYDEIDAGDFDDVPFETTGYRADGAHVAHEAHATASASREFGAGIFERG